MVVNPRQETIDSYNKSANALAEYFATIGSRIEDIDLAFRLAGDPINPHVVEIGCGDGRDAQEIVKRTNNYQGFDISTAMIDLATAKVPDGRFEVADAVTYDFPSGTDIVFAFASLLHLNREELGDVFARLQLALKPGGLVYLSLKHADTYHTEVKEDVFGKRLFYFYNPDEISALAQGFTTLHVDHSRIGETPWFEMAAQKSSD